jgi:uncharacterized SAM-binding protein YcdF (DUF218 family)
MTPEKGPTQAAHVVCVLGCPVGSEALGRRARAASELFLARRSSMVLACGGRAWRGTVEADELRSLMVSAGVPDGAIVRERCSLDTRDNARFAAALLGRRGLSSVLLVTCSWHLPRAERLFRAAGLEVEGAPVDPPTSTLLQRFYRRERERLSSWKDARRSVRFV